MHPLLSPLALAIALIWNVAVLASVQLTVRLIMAFAVWPTLVAAAVLTLFTVPLSVAYDLVFGPSLTALPLAMLLTAVAGYLIATRVLGFRRLRSATIAAIGVGLLSAPWGVFLVGLNR
jgi:hypothetical protein